jgi:hypothetical protein
MFIPDPDIHFLPLLDTGVKNAPDPGFESAALHNTPILLRCNAGTT